MPQLISLRFIAAAAIILILFTLAGAATPETPDIVIADFEGVDWGTWKAEGNAFGVGPAHGTLAKQQEVTGFEGKGLVDTYQDGDNSQGTLTSPPIKIEHPFINFLIGGGNRPGEACVNLQLDGKVLRSATGHDDEHLDWTSWDVHDLIGKSVVLQIVDHATGSWGHINVDQIVQSDHRKGNDTQPAVSTAVFYDETYRPQFHFTSKTNSLNDPNGLVFRDGEYHLFFQHNPAGNTWGNMTWGHAISPDLVHWKQGDDAIVPDRLGTIFSGSAVIDHDNTAGFGKGAMVCIYTAAGGTNAESKGQLFTQCLAFSMDGRTFTKYDKNPVLPHLVRENRDPRLVWFEPTRQWILALFKDGSTYALFSSPDLKNWTHLQDINMEGCGECPDFFPMPIDGDKKNVKWVFTAANGMYLVGSFDGKKFVPDDAHPFRADWGKNYYAVQSYSNIAADDGRRIQMAWMTGGKYPGMPFNQQMSFPCQMTLRTTPGGLRIFRNPIREIENLHTGKKGWADLALKQGDDPLVGIKAAVFELRAEVEPGKATEVIFSLRGHPVTWRVKENTLSSLGATSPLPPGMKTLKLQVLVDRTSMEIFAADGEIALTSCFLPDPKNESVSIKSASGTAHIQSLEVYELQSAWNP